MHVLLVSPCNQVLMPYLRNYEEILERNGISYDLIYWDRFSVTETERENYHCLHCHAPGSSGLLSGLMGYLRFRSFFISQHKLILQKHPDTVVICLNTQSAVLLTLELRRRHYMLDVRDYTHEGCAPYRYLANRMMRKALLIAISSEGFRTWLQPGLDYVATHNVCKSELCRVPVSWPTHRIRISCIGAIRNASDNIAFMDALYATPDGVETDEFADLYFIGYGVGDSESALQEHCHKRGYERVHFIGRYRPEEAARFYEECHFVLGIYGCDTLFERTLTPNRFYQAAIHRRPIIVSEGTYLAELVRKHGLGIVFKGDGIALRKEIVRYNDADIRRTFNANCKRFLEQVGRDLDSFERQLLSRD